MPDICLYFQVHQPYRMGHYHFFDIGRHHTYFDEAKNREICQKVAQKCYLPANRLILDLLKKHPEFRLAFSISGVALEQFQAYAPEVIRSFQRLVNTGRVELLCETYHHSLAALYSPTEFKDQVAKQQRLLKKLFGVKPTVFRNTELIYSEAIGELVSELGFSAVLTEGIERIQGFQGPNQLYRSTSSPNLTLLLKNYKLSDDIAFRFSERSWKEWPLRAATFAHWLHSIPQAQTINLFMDYETLGEHQWADTGIFDFFAQLPAEVLKGPDFGFATPSEVVAKYPPTDFLSVPEPISWADSERDLSAWTGNPMQDTTLAWLYSLEKLVRESKNRRLRADWQKLQTSDHFYYMCTKHWSDGEVHKYFSVYETPHQSYTIMNNVLTDLQWRLVDI